MQILLHSKYEQNRGNLKEILSVELFIHSTESSMNAFLSLELILHLVMNNSILTFPLPVSPYLKVLFITNIHLVFFLFPQNCRLFGSLE